MRFNYTKHGNIMTKEKDVAKYFSKVALHTYRPNILIEYYIRLKNYFTLENGYLIN